MVVLRPSEMASTPTAEIVSHVITAEWRLADIYHIYIYCWKLLCCYTGIFIW